MITCSFCKKTQYEVNIMIAGDPGIAICSECVNFCVKILKIKGSYHHTWRNKYRHMWE